MTTPLEIEFNEGLYHVTSRGDGQADIYLGDVCRNTFLELLAEAR